MSERSMPAWRARPMRESSRGATWRKSSQALSTIASAPTPNSEFPGRPGERRRRVLRPRAASRFSRSARLPGAGCAATRDACLGPPGVVIADPACASDRLSNRPAEHRRNGLMFTDARVRHFELAEPRRALHHGAAALEAPLHEPGECGIERRIPPELLRKHDTVLDGQTAAVRCVRRGRMRGIADQDDSSAIPGRGNEKHFERPIVDLGVATEALTQLPPNTPERREALGEQL